MSDGIGNYPIWGSNGELNVLTDVTVGLSCGVASPYTLNYGFNRIDNAITTLNTCVVEHTGQIEGLTDQVNNIAGSIEKTGILGVYVVDSRSTISTFAENSAGEGAAATIQSMNHVIQADGDVHLIVGYEANVVTIPYQNTNCVGQGRLLVNGNFAMVHQYGSVKNGTTNPAVTFQGGVSPLRNINAGYDWAFLGQQPFPTFQKGQNVNLRLEAFITEGHSGSINFGFVKIVVIELRAP